MCWWFGSTKAVSSRYAGGLVAPNVSSEGAGGLVAPTVSSECAGGLVAPRLYIQGMLVVW